MAGSVQGNLRSVPEFADSYIPDCGTGTPGGNSKRYAGVYLPPKEFAFARTPRLPAPTDESPPFYHAGNILRPVGDVNSSEIFQRNMRKGEAEARMGTEHPLAQAERRQTPAPHDHESLEIFPALLGRTHGAANASP